MTKTWIPAFVLGAALVLAGCSGTAPVPAPTLSEPSVSPSRSTQAPPTPEDEAALHAEEVLRQYYRTKSGCLADPPKTPITCFDQVAIGTERTNLRNALVTARQMGTRVTGDVLLESVTRKSVDLTNKVNETPPTVPTVVFEVCRDASGYNILDKDGKSIVPPDRVPRALVDVSVYNYEMPDPSKWRVGYVAPVEGSTC